MDLCGQIHSKQFWIKEINMKKQYIAFDNLSGTDCIGPTNTKEELLILIQDFCETNNCNASNLTLFEEIGEEVEVKYSLISKKK